MDRTQLSSSVLECIRGSGPCLELGDRAAQSWPPGGTGRPIAVSSVSSLQDEILIKMIIGVDHGAMDIKVPCNMQPFSFGSGPPPFALQPYPGFYSHPKTKVLASRREAAKGLGLLAETIARDLARLYCSDRRSSDRVEANFVLSEAVGCVVSATESLALLDNGVSEMDAAIGSNEEETRRSLQVVSIESRRVSALCTSAAALSVLITVTASITVSLVCARSRVYRGYTKLE